MMTPHELVERPLLASREPREQFHLVGRRGQP